MSKIADVTSLAPAAAMRAMLQRIATGPDLSKPLSQTEACYGMQLILDGAADPVQAAIFLIALRMKRETAEENRGVLDAIRAATETVHVAVDDLVDLADPYNGYARTLPAAAFLPAVLSACAIPTVSHGVWSMGPKFGVTHAQVLAAAGVDTQLSSVAAARQVEGPAAWAYLGQHMFCSKLFALERLRTQIVKRPVITTVEVLARPLLASGRAHLVTGYVHKPYPPVYTMLARHVGFDSCLLLRGTEGGVIPSLRQPGKAVRFYRGELDEELDLSPQECAITQSLRAAPVPDSVLQSAADPGVPDGPAFSVEALARAAACAGLDALAGAHGPVRDGLVYAAAHIVNHVTKRDDVQRCAREVRAVLDDGRAAERFQLAQGLSPQVH